MIYIHCNPCQMDRLVKKLAADWMTEVLVLAGAWILIVVTLYTLPEGYARIWLYKSGKTAPPYTFMT